MPNSLFAVMPSKSMKKFGFMSLPLCCLSLLLLVSLPVFSKVEVRSASEVSNDATDWMKKVADWQLTRSSWDSSVDWLRGALHPGMIACYEATKDETYLDKCRQWAEKFNWELSSTSHHADNNAVGQAFMELYFLDAQDPSRYSGTSRRFKEVSDAHVGIWPEYTCSGNSSDDWWWCDALFMAPPGLVRLSRATGDSSYTDLMHMMWEDTQGCLYDTEQHLFFRDMGYVNRTNCVGESVFWSRGNGWVLAGTARVLQYLPQSDPNRARYETLLQEMCAKLKDIQYTDGYWHSDLLGPTCYDNPETSGTGFFTFGIAWGINNGYLDAATYWPTVQTGWEALKAAVQPSGLLGWVQPVGAGPTGTSATTTDVFGVGAYLLAGSEVQKYLLAHDPNSIEYFESYASDTTLKAAWNDGSTNGTSSQVALGDYGDNFMELTYQNDLSPYRSETVYTFASPKDFTANNAYYLSILVRGNAANTAEQMYVQLEDSNTDTSVQVMTDTTVVQTAAWMELGFPLADFTGINRTQIRKLTIGVGDPAASSATGQGTIRIDNIRLARSGCVSIPQDINSDCKVNLLDFAVLASQWQDIYGTQISPTDPGTTNLVAYWPLDGDYNDAIGNHDATAGASVVFDTTGHIDQSAYFDATDNKSYLDCTNSNNMDLDQGLTISAWVKSPGLIDPYASVVTKGVTAWRLIRNNSSSSISFHFNAAGGGEYQANGDTNVLDNEWHHLMGIYDGVNVSLYVDGQLDASGSAGAVNTTNDPVYIGSRVNNTTNRNWIGNIDEVRIYDRALNTEERLWLSEGDPYTQIPDPPRKTDLVLDGTIDIKDQAKLLEKWSQDVRWP